MATLPPALPAGKPTPLVRTVRRCPCCDTALQAWALSLYQPPASVFWCGTCARPVCLDQPVLQEVRHV